MRVVFANLETEIPDGWIDSSTITFVRPGTSAGERASLVITWQEESSTDNPQSYLEKRLESLFSLLPGFQILRRGDAGTPEEPLPYAEFLVEKEEDWPLRQILLVRRVGERIACVTGTADVAGYEQVRPAFVAAAKHLRSPGGG